MSVPRGTLHPTESQMQVAVIAWCRLQRNGLEQAIHIPNEGKRSPRRGAQLKREGMKPGVLDIFIPLAKGGWHGMWLELKSHGKKPTADQSRFLTGMIAQGYLAAWTDSQDVALRMLADYAAGRTVRPNWVHYSQAMVKTP